MRIGLVIERMETWRGGAETSTAQFARELLARGHKVSLFTSSWGLSEPGVEVHTLQLPKTRSRRALAFREAVEAAVDRYPVDIAHSMTPLYGGDVFMPRGGTVAETIEGNIRIRRTAAGRAMKRLLNRFNRRQRTMLQMEADLLGRNPPPRVIALSQYVVQQLRKHYGLEAPRVVEVFNAVQVPSGADDRESARRTVREKWKVPDDVHLLLFVAHNFKLKGLAQLLDAVRELERRGRRDWRLMVVGRDRVRPYVTRANHLGIEPRVIFTGSTERVTRLYQAADLLVLPTFYDPCSRVVLEALTLGTPAVTTRYNGAGEMLAGLNGNPPAGRVIADPNNVSELADAIIEMLDPQRRKEASQAAVALIDRLSMKRHTEEMLKIYEELAAGK